MKNKKGAKEAGLLSVWIPLNFPALVEMNEESFGADITLSNIYELKSLLVVEDESPTLSANGNARSQKLKASRSNSNGPLTPSSLACPSTGCFSSSKAKSRRFLSPPELENSNSNASNASDGS